MRLEYSDGEELERFLEQLGVEAVQAELQPKPALRLRNFYYHGIPEALEAEAFREVLEVYSRASRENTLSGSVVVFTTPTCRYCARAVLACAEVAAANEGVEVHVYDAPRFMELARRAGVVVVPKIVVNEGRVIETHTTRAEYRALVEDALRG
ncbi:MAG: hypothetical protein GXN98_02630 [Euryarchaeota archaeon]|nr:hypothetical protein [Euryarchaeota archaeon]